MELTGAEVKAVVLETIEELEQKLLHLNDEFCRDVSSVSLQHVRKLFLSKLSQLENKTD